MDKQTLTAASSQAPTRKSDKDQIAHLEKQIRKLERSLASHRDSLSDQISVAKRTRNALVPCHRLPAEVILRTFALALSGTCGREYYKAMYKIARVSTVFYGLINNTPTLWSVLSTQLPERVNQAILLKSKKSPLTLDIAQPEGSTVHKLIQSVSKEMSRLHSLSIPSRVENAQGLLRLAAPTLQQLTLWSTWTQTGVPELLVENMPNLRDLVLRGAMPKIEWKSFSNLLSLEITNQGGNVGKALSVQEVLEIVANNPLLETLVLENIRFTSLEAPSDHRSTALPRLSRLWLHLPHAATKTLLEHLSVPNCKQLRLQCTESALDPVFWDDEPTEYNDHFDGYLDQFSHALCSTNRSSNPNMPMAIRLGHSYISFCLGGVDIESRTTAPYKMLEWIASSLNEDPVTRECYLLLQPEAIPSDKNLHNSLNKFSFVTTIRLQAQQHCNEFFEYLSQPEAVGSTLRWPLPRLARIYVTGGDLEAHVVLDMVRTRYGKAGLGHQRRRAGGKDPATEVVSLPTPLKMLDLGNAGDYDQDLWEEFVELVGKDKFNWDTPAPDSDHSDIDDHLGREYHEMDELPSDEDEW